MFFYSVWLKIILHPTIENIHDIVSSLGGGIKTACKWIFFSSLLTYWLLAIILILTQVVFASPSEVNQFEDQSQQSTLLILGFFVGLPIISAMSVGLLLLTTGVTHKILSFLGQKGKYAQFVYIISSFISPLLIIRIIIFDLLTYQLIIVPIGLYASILAIISIRAVYGAKLGMAMVLGIPIALILVVPPQLFLAL
jgi:hypothetical protein